MKYMKKSFSNMKPYHSALITDGIVLNANESTINPPKYIIDKFYEEIKEVDFNRYPDMDEVALCKAIAKRFNIDYKNVTCGVGSDELLEATFKAVLEVNDCVLGFTPSFSMYKVFAEMVGANYIPILGNDEMQFNIDDMILSIKENNPKLVLICSPNNPTGQFFTKADVKKIIESTDALVILDLAYIDFAYEDYSLISLEYDNVIAFRTFSKAMALPSMRVGYAISNSDNIDMINAVKAPYSVTTLSQIMARIAIENIELYDEQIKLFKSERARLYDGLISLGFKAFKSEANFIYVIMDDYYNDILLENKIYIRGFKSNHYRITVGKKEENDKLLEVLSNANCKR